MTRGTQPTTRIDPGLEQIGRSETGWYVEQSVGGISDVVRCVWSSQVAAAPSAPPARVLPDNCGDVIVSDDGRAWFVGPATRVDLPDLAPGTVVHGLRIQPHALGAAIDADPAELTDTRTGLDALLSARAARILPEALAAGAIDHVLLSQLWPRITLDDRATRGIQMLGEATRCSVESVAEACAMSERQFRRTVRRVSGLPPKTLQRVARLHRALDLARQYPGLDLSRIAVAAGYADQPHFARDARELADLTPRQLVEVHV